MSRLKIWNQIVQNYETDEHGRERLAGTGGRFGQNGQMRPDLPGFAADSAGLSFPATLFREGHGAGQRERLILAKPLILMYTAGMK